jgi:hypothetical protein
VPGRKVSDHLHAISGTKGLTIGEVPPVQEVCVVLLAGLHEELPICVGMGDIFNASTRFGESNAIVFDDWRTADWMEGLVLGRREQRASLIVLERVFNAELLA